MVERQKRMECPSPSYLDRCRHTGADAHTHADTHTHAHSNTDDPTRADPAVDTGQRVSADGHVACQHKRAVAVSQQLTANRLMAQVPSVLVGS